MLSAELSHLWYIRISGITSMLVGKKVNVGGGVERNDRGKQWRHPGALLAYLLHDFTFDVWDWDVRFKVVANIIKHICDGAAHPCVNQRHGVLHLPILGGDNGHEFLCVSHVGSSLRKVDERGVRGDGVSRVVVGRTVRGKDVAWKWGWKMIIISCVGNFLVEGGGQSSGDKTWRFVGDDPPPPLPPPTPCTHICTLYRGICTSNFSILRRSAKQAVRTERALQAESATVAVVER